MFTETNTHSMDPAAVPGGPPWFPQLNGLEEPVALA